MIIDTKFTASYKCPFCGRFDFFEIDSFSLKKDISLNFVCGCSKKGIDIKLISNNKFEVDFPCIGCGGRHQINVSVKDILQKGLMVYNCPITGIKQCFIGKDENVRRSIDKLEKDFDELINKLGYDSYFQNSHVMLDILNKLHDLAQRRKLLCRCGSKDIELFLFSDKIYLKCNYCQAGSSIIAASNIDLKNILSAKEILISK